MIKDALNLLHEIILNQFTKHHSTRESQLGIAQIRPATPNLYIHLRTHWKLEIPPFTSDVF